MKTFTFYTDPGHGWLKVSLSNLASLGFLPSDFSRYSYKKNDNLYLEEDCDAAKFVLAYKTKHGVSLKHKESHTDRQSRIRSYSPNDGRPT